MTDFRDNLRGILAMLACCFFFILNDTMVKAVGEDLPLGQIIALRGVFSTAIIGFVAWRARLLPRLARHLDRRIALRTIGEVGATFLFLSALMHMPLANITAIAQAAPLVITAAGALFLGEQVGWRRWTAVAIGFGGILVIVRPGTDGFNGWAVFAFGSVLLVALRDVVTRTIPATTPTLAITTITSVAVMVAGFLLSLGEDWEPVGTKQALLLGGSATCLLLGFVAVITAMRSGDVAVVAPFRYAFIPYSIVIGWIVWGDVPDALTLIGIVVVVGTGVYTFCRERRAALGRRRKAAPAVAAGTGGG